MRGCGDDLDLARGGAFAGASAASGKHRRGSEDEGRQERPYAAWKHHGPRHYRNKTRSCYWPAEPVRERRSSPQCPDGSLPGDVGMAIAH